jgi:eukaryotic-like serine/threonine-protein kinase
MAGQAIEGLCANCLLALALTPRDQAEEATGVPLNGPTKTLRVGYFGDYELLEEIARGGMGVVYRARQVTLNRLVALKLISTGTFIAPNLVERFKTEAEAVARLTHPNIVPIYEIGEYQGQPYFSMGLIEGANLREILRRPTNLPVEKRPRGNTNRNRKGEATPSDIPSVEASGGLKHETRLAAPLKPAQERIQWAAHLLATIARAVHYAHQRGVLHRDLKPSNILVEANGTPHLTDFGLAKLIEKESTLTRPNDVLGTPAYMAPEQVRGETNNVTTGVDVYGLGAVLYETLTGSPPFQGGTSMETLRQVLDQEPCQPSLCNPAIDRDLETICVKCLEKDPQRRYASADALANDLDRWSRGETIQARPSTSWERANKWAKRNPALAALAGVSSVAMLLLLAGLFISNKLIRRQQAETRRANARLEVERNQTKDALELEKRVSYINRIALATREWQANNLRRADLILDQCAVDLRQWEWHYLKRLCNHSLSLALRERDESTELREVFGNPFPISGDGRRIALVLDEKCVKIVEALTGNEIRTVCVSGNHVLCIAISLDGLLVAAADSGDREDGRSVLPRAYLWEAATGRELLNDLGTTNSFHGLAFSADGRQLFGMNRRCELTSWDTETGEMAGVMKLEAASFCGPMAFSRDGRMLALASSTNIGIWNPATGQHLLTLKEHQWFTRGLVFHPNGQQLAAGFDNSIRMWDLKENEELFPFSAASEHLSGVTCLAYSHDGRYLASSAGVTVRVWDTERREQVHEFRNAWEIDSLAFAPDGKRLITMGPRRLWGDEMSTRLKLWDLTSSQEAMVFRHGTGCWTVTFSPDGRHLACSHENEGSVSIWDLTTRQLARHLTNDAAVFGLSYNNDGSELAAARRDGSIVIWNPLEGEIIQVLEGDRFATRSLAFSSDGKHLASLNVGGKLRVWDATTGLPLVSFTNQSPFASWLEPLDYSSDGKRLVVATEQGIVCVVDATTGQEQLHLKGHQGSVSGLDFSPDGRRIASAGSDGTIKLWDGQTGELLITMGGDDPGTEFQRITFSPDGQRLAATTGLSTKLLDLSGHELLVLEGGVLGVSFSPDGRRLAAGGRDGTLRVWETTEPSFQTMPEFVAAYEGSSKVIADKGTAREARAEALVSRSRMLRQMNRPAEAQADFLLAKEIPSRNPKAPAILIDLSPFYNGSLQRNWFGEDPNNDLASLPKGLQTFGGVRFDVRGLVQLRGGPAALSAFPSAVRNIPIGRQCRKLQVLHGAIGTSSNEQRVVSEFILHYETTNNLVQHELIVLGIDVLDWQTDPNSLEDVGSKIAWTGTNSQDKPIYLYQSTLNVHRWDVPIKSVDLRNGVTSAASFLIAITVE